MPDWRDWLYETDPVWDYPDLRGELSVPGMSRRLNIADPLTGRPYDFPPSPSPQDRVDMSGGQAERLPNIMGKERTGRKTKLGTALLDILPRALEAGIAGAATPNIAGGGPTDFFRAAQAGGQALDKRDANRLAMEQQYQQMAQQEALRRSQEQMYGAHADLYRAQAQAELTPKPGFLELYNQLLPLLGPERAAIVASKGSLQHMKQEEPYKDMTRVDEGHPLASYGRPDGKGGYWVPNEIVTTAMRPEPREPRPPAPPAPHYFTDASGRVTAVTPGEGGQFQTTPVGNKPIAAGRREPAGAKPPGPQAFITAKNRRSDALAKAEEKHAKAVEAANIYDPGGMIPKGPVDWKDPVQAAAAQAKIIAADAALQREQARIEQEYKETERLLLSAPGSRQPAAAPAKPQRGLRSWEREGVK